MDATYRSLWNHREVLNHAPGAPKPLKEFNAIPVPAEIRKVWDDTIAGLEALDSAK